MQIINDDMCTTYYLFYDTLWPCGQNIKRQESCGDSATWRQVRVLPEYLGGLGYRSHAVGKWHLGSHTQGVTPTHRHLNL